MKKLLQQAWRAVKGDQPTVRSPAAGAAPAAPDAGLAARFDAALQALQSGRVAEAQSAFERILQQHPDHAPALHFLGVSHAQSGNPAEAERLILRSLAVAAVPDYFNNLALLYEQQGRRDDAITASREAWQRGPDNSRAGEVLGDRLRAAGRHAEAETVYRDVIVLHPDAALAHYGLANLLLKLERREEALAAYREAVRCKPDFAEAWTNIALLQSTAGQDAAAESSLRQALALRPDHYVLHHHLGDLLVRTRRLAEAEVAYRRALELNPEDAEACSHVAARLHEQGKLEEAEALHRRALALQPGSPLVHYNLGRLLLELRRLAEAEQAFRTTLELRPDIAEAHDSLGTVFREAGRFAEAEAAYRQALALQPDSAGTEVNLGSVLQARECYAEAEAAYRRALALEPDHDLAHYNLALLQLTRKQWPAGWPGYERRWKLKGFNLPRHAFPQQPWPGEPRPGESLLVWQEQGVGDTVLYAGMLSDLQQQGMALMIECEDRLLPLLARSFPQAQVVPSRSPPHPATRDMRWQSALGSLCRWLRSRVDSFSWRGPYLVPDAGRVAACRQRYRALGAGPVIGLSWRSSNYKVGAQKSLELQQWAALLAQPGAVFVNLQYGDCREELAQLQRATGITVHQDDSINPLQDLDGFAAQVAAMDLVISTSNSTVHFAGALEVPVWMLLPRGGGALLWYWFDAGELSPWYPSLRIYRQDAPGDWSQPLARVAAGLRDFIAAYRA